MANKKGRGLLMVYCDVPLDVEEEFNQWYNQEHIPERLSIPGVLNAARYEAVQGGPKYLACYELDTHQAWHSPEWQNWLNNPTEWSRRMSPSVVATTYIRNLYRLIYPDNVDEQTSQADMAPVMLVGRMSVPAELDVPIQPELQPGTAARMLFDARLRERPPVRGRYGRAPVPDDT